MYKSFLLWKQHGTLYYFRYLQIFNSFFVLPPSPVISLFLFFSIRQPSFYPYFLPSYLYFFLSFFLSVFLSIFHSFFLSFYKSLFLSFFLSFSLAYLTSCFLSLILSCFFLSHLLLIFPRNLEKHFSFTRFAPVIWYASFLNLNRDLNLDKGIQSSGFDWPRWEANAAC